jgi:hypothetical protein
MWVTFCQRGSGGRTKKFNIPSTDMSLTRETSEGIWDRIDRLEEPERKLAGFAILRKDPKTGLLHWATFDGEGGDFKEYPPAHPLLFPAEAGKLPVGTRVELHVVVES